MPRGTIDIGREVEYLSILDESGALDESLEPEVSDDLLLRLHRAMLLIRRFDAAMLSLQRQGKIGTFGPVNGQEAAQLGPMAACTEDDWLIPSYREIGALIWRGIPLSGILLYNAGYTEGGEIPAGVNALPISIPVGTQMLHAAGIAYGMKRRGRETCAVSYFGDGATSEGDFHEAMNFAGVFRVPMVFVCTNNQYAISVPREHQTPAPTLAQKALAYDMPGVKVDGNDILAMLVAAREAKQRAVDDGQPTLIEAMTYRLGIHTTADDPAKYRSEEEEEAWAEVEPLKRFQTYLMEHRKILSATALEQLEEEVEKQIEAAWDDCQREMERLGDPDAMFEHHFATMPDTLHEQREAFRAMRGES